jgi:hypothetical protein
MIRISGILNVKSIKGSRGAFSVGELTSSVGSFKVKDQILDQFSEGSYEGEFLVAHIYPASYVHYGRVITEIRAKLAEIILPEGEEKPLPEQTVPQEPDPVEEPQPVVAASPAEAPADAAVDTQAAAGPLTEEEAKDLALFGAELYGAVTKRDAIKLDPTVDRLKFRAQRDRLKGLGYRFDAARQAWGFEEVTA